MGFSSTIGRVGGRAAVWAASNVVEDLKYWDDNDSQAVSVSVARDGDDYKIILANHEHDGAAYTQECSGLSTATKYYLTVDRPDAAAVRLRIYSDADRTTLVDTLTVAVDAGRTWRHVFGANSYNDGNSGHTISFDVENLAEGHSTKTDYLYNESWQVLEERKDGSALPSAQVLWDVRYIDAPVLRWRDAYGNGSLTETLYVTTDANMSVTALIDPDTGEAVERYSFAAYGQPTFYGGDWSIRAESAYASEVLYCGYRFDPETGLYQVRFRYYHPTIGCWTVRDPIGYGDTIGLYQYVSSNSVGHIDPMGCQAGAGLQYSQDMFTTPQFISDIVSGAKQIFVNGAPEAFELAGHWAGSSSASPIVEWGGGPWAEFFMGQESVREGARQLLRDEAKQAWNSVSITGEFFQDKMITLSRGLWTTGTINGFTYEIFGTYEVTREECEVSLRYLLHTVSDTMDAHWEALFPDVPMVAVNKMSSSRFQWFDFEVGWNGDDVEFVMNTDGQIRSEKGGWPFGK